jgi:hypothetical protein
MLFADFAFQCVMLFGAMRCGALLIVTSHFSLHKPFRMTIASVAPPTRRMHRTSLLRRRMHRTSLLRRRSF